MSAYQESVLGKQSLENGNLHQQNDQSLIDYGFTPVTAAEVMALPEYETL